MVLLKQLIMRGTQSSVNFTTSGTMLDDEGMCWWFSTSGMVGSKHIMRYGTERRKCNNGNGVHFQQRLRLCLAIFHIHVM